MTASTNASDTGPRPRPRCRCIAPERDRSAIPSPAGSPASPRDPSPNHSLDPAAELTRRPERIEQGEVVIGRQRGRERLACSADATEQTLERSINGADMQ